MIGIGLIIPSLPDVVRRFVVDEQFVSEYFGYFIATYALMQFVASPLLGALSDLYGRRPILLVSLCMAALDYVMMAFAPNLTVLFIGRMISGLTGASITVCMAYIADISTDENRSSNYGLIGAAFGLGFIIGPAIGGLLGGRFGPQAAFLAAASLNFLNFLFGLFILPESFPKEKRRRIQFQKLNPFQSLAHIFNSPVILSLALVHFLFQLGGHTHESIWALYTHHRYGWDTMQIGISLAVVGVLSAVSQGWLTQLITPKLGEYKTVVIAAFAYIISFLLFGLASKGWMLYVILMGSAVFWVGHPALQSLATRQVSQDDQGEFQGCLVSLTSLANILSPLIVTQLFAYFTNKNNLYFPGAPYFFAALMSGLAFWVIWNRKIT